MIQVWLKKRKNIPLCRKTGENTAKSLDLKTRVWYIYYRADRNGLFKFCIFFVFFARFGAKKEKNRTPRILRDWKEEVKHNVRNHRER